MSFDADRRKLLQALMAGGCVALVEGPGAIREVRAQDEATGGPMLAGVKGDLARHPARWWKELDGGRVECGLCPRKCRVADRERGACGVRENRGGKYYSLVYGRPCSLHLDPIEKKPLNHVLPGTMALSLATPGCNIECRFCQNWQIAQVRPEQVPTYPLNAKQIAVLARRHNAPSVACTYTEPVVFSEYVYDIAEESRKVGVRGLMISNGYIQEEPLKDLMSVLSAVKIDLKAFTEKFYHDVCSGELKPVLDTLRRLRHGGMWTEIVVLVIPTLNDSEAEARQLARFVRDDLGAEVPVHFTRFHPAYRLTNLPGTPVVTLERLRNAAMAEGLQFVYIGNVPGHPGENTYCPGCGRLLIRRLGMSVSENHLKDGKCPYCGRVIPGIWK